MGLNMMHHGAVSVRGVDNVLTTRGSVVVQGRFSLGIRTFAQQKFSLGTSMFLLLLCL